MLFFKLQYRLLILLLLLCVFPLIAFNLFIPMDVPKIYIFFLCCLIGLRISFYKDKPFRSELNKRVRDELLKESGKPPSKDQMVSRVQAHIDARDLMFGICGVLIFLVSAVMGKL